MTMTFASQLRTTDETIMLGEGSAAADRITIRAQLAEVWDLIRISAGSATTVGEVKEATLHRLFPGFVSPSDYYVKLNGLEVLDESVGLAEAGARNGSTFLITLRRKRPVR